VSGAPSTRVTIAVAILAVGVAQGFGRFTYPLLLPAIDGDLLHSYAVAGFLGSLNLAAYVVGTAIASFASGRVEPPYLIRGGLVLAVVGLVVLSVAGGVVLVAVGLVATGIAGALIWIPAPGVVGAIVPPERRGFAIGLLGSGIGGSIFVASQLTALVRHLEGATAWREVWTIEAIASVGVALAAWRWLRAERSGFAPARVGLDALRSVPGWRSLTAAYAAYGLSYSLFMSYLVAALERDAGFAPAHAARVFALVGLALIFGGITVGRLSDRFGRRPTLVWGFLVWAGCALVILTGREPWVSLAAATFGLMMSGLGSVIAATVADDLDPRAFGAAFGAITLCFGVAQMIGPQLGGWIAERSGSFSAAFELSAAAAFAGAASSFALPRRPSRVERT
jgi:predicted MFS family arabinose efflux permease